MLSRGERHLGAARSEKRLVRSNQAPSSKPVDGSERLARPYQRASAKHRSDPRQQFARIEGFGQIIVRPHLESDDPVDVLAASREHHQSQIRHGFAQAPTDGQSVLSGKADVEHGNIELVVAEFLVQRRGVGRRHDLTVILTQVPGDQRCDLVIVLDNDDACSGAVEDLQLRVVHHPSRKACRGVHGHSIPTILLPAQAVTSPALRRLRLTIPACSAGSLSVAPLSMSKSRGGPAALFCSITGRWRASTDGARATFTA